MRQTMCINERAHSTNCIFEDETAQNSESLGDSTPFYVLGLREGYPPRVVLLDSFLFVSHTHKTRSVVKIKAFSSFIGSLKS
jgi:hypothetical protein